MGRSPLYICHNRSHSTDAVLLIAAILPDQDLSYFLKIVQSVGMTALVEVHTLNLIGCFTSSLNRWLFVYYFFVIGKFK